MKSIQNLVLFCQLVLKKKQILLLIKGCNSVANLRKTKINNTNVDLVNDNAQGQVTLQSAVRSGQISNSSKTVWLSSLPAKMKKIRSKIEALECSQHYTSNFQTCKRRQLWCLWWYLAEIRTHPSFHACPPYLQE